MSSRPLRKIVRLVAQSLKIRIWQPFEATAASEVKTEAAGEIGDPNLQYDQV